MAQACDELEALLNNAGGGGFGGGYDGYDDPGGDPYVDASYEPVD